MNKIEQRALDALGKEEKEKIAGGVKETDDLSKEQCENLKNAVSALSESEQMQIAGGDSQEPVQTTEIEEERQERIRRLASLPMIIAYGCPQPRQIFDIPSVLKEKEEIKNEQNSNL